MQKFLLKKQPIFSKYSIALLPFRLSQTRQKMLLQQIERANGMVSLVATVDELQHFTSTRDHQAGDTRTKIIVCEDSLSCQLEIMELLGGSEKNDHQAKKRKYHDENSFHQPVTYLKWITDSLQQQRQLSLDNYTIAITNTGRSIDGIDSNFDEPKKIKKCPSSLTLQWSGTDQDPLITLTVTSSATSKESTTKCACNSIHGFDLDGTLIVTKSGKRFAENANDWKWLSPQVPMRLREEYDRGNFIFILSNQNGVAKGKTSLGELKMKIEAIVDQLGIPLVILLATKNDMMRKPRIGAWNHMIEKHFKNDRSNIDLMSSVFVGDAAGRPNNKREKRKKDFSASDYKFALNVGIPFQTPEMYFINSSEKTHCDPAYFELGAFNPTLLLDSDGCGDSTILDPPEAPLSIQTREMVILVGSPASGKSTFAQTHFSTYYRINQDQLGTLARCQQHCQQALAEDKQQSIIIDNTNRFMKDREKWIKIAREFELPVRCFYFNVTKDLAFHLNIFRELNAGPSVPAIAIHTFYKYLEQPRVEEGFDAVITVKFQCYPTLQPSAKQLLLSYLL